MDCWMGGWVGGRAAGWLAGWFYSYFPFLLPDPSCGSRSYVDPVWLFRPLSFAVLEVKSSLLKDDCEICHCNCKLLLKTKVMEKFHYDLDSEADTAFEAGNYTIADSGVGNDGDAEIQRQRWDLNYREAAIFLQEGENNDKFTAHPRQQVHKFTSEC